MSSPAAPLRDQLQATLGGAYTLERELSGGGMSRVFVATENRLRRSVVVKVLSPELAAGVNAERFEREIQLAAALQQANIVPLLTAGDMMGLPYYTMPFVTGESLRARLSRDGRMPIHEAVGVLRDVARALGYAHASGVVHRDIKPDNVLLSHGTAVVTDFGIAKAISLSRTEAGGTTLTQAGTSIGTPAYMAPEQAAGDPDVDHRADIYAFGCMAYELLAGHPPFAGTTAQRVLAAHLSERPKPIRDDHPEVPRGLAALVMRCLEKEPANRPSSADDIVQTLDSMATPSGEQAPALPGRAWRERALKWAAPAVLAAVLLAATAVGVTRLRARSATTVDRSVAVLPLANLSGDKSDDYFGEGLAEEITDALGKAGLRVIGRGSARTLVAQGLDAQAVGQRLGVANIVQGSVQRAGNRVRITVALVAARDGTIEWSDKFDREMKDVFAVQDEIARSVASQLNMAVSGRRALVRQETNDPEAHALYLQGLYLWNRRSPQTLRQAIELFQRATQRDQNYARAYAGIAMAYAVLPLYDDVPSDATLAKAREASRRALAIDSTLSEAHAANGYVDAVVFDNAASEREFRQAIALDSSSATAHFWYALLLGHTGRSDSAIAEHARARALDPTSLIIQVGMGEETYRAHHLAAADSLYRNIVALDSTFQIGTFNLAKVDVSEGKTTEAIQLLERIVDKPGLRSAIKIGELAYAYARAGRAADARRVLLKLPSDTTLSAVGSVACALYALGDRDKGVDMLRRAIAQHDEELMIAGGGPEYDALRKDPRAAPMIARIEAR